ncbi:hypothetical protein PR048_003939 [Dryococelus australis]|uniref:DDE Tnp4 domain-containing protein n=1 Tax=Dryococelus australis TaxID=614101 RepID=A0ABQ9I4X7_9NEOP|nr:hypothetical protein PR048_003939 [Dryococelus australis]
MNVETYNMLLKLVTPEIIKQSTCMRKAISSHERLVATINFLSTCRSYKDLEFATILSKQTVSQVIPKTCRTIYKALRRDYLKNWIQTAAEFERKWQFHHCLDAIDSKYIRITPPKGSGSYFFNCKKTNSVVLLVIANANCEFVYCDVGTNDSVSNGGVINNTKLYDKLVNNDLRDPLPRSSSMSNRDVEYVFVGVIAVVMRRDLIKPYRRETLDKEGKYLIIACPDLDVLSKSLSVFWHHDSAFSI